jgi:hypothetical protein
MMQVRNSAGVATRQTFGGTMRHLFGIFAPAETFAMAGRAVGIFLLVIGTVFGGGLVSAGVYGNAAPGDTFYSLKTAMETVQLTLAPNEEYKIQLHAEFADRRMDELSRLAENGPDRRQYVPQVLAAFERDVLALQTGLEKTKTDFPASAADVAKLLERKMAVYQNLLRKAGNLLAPDHAAAVAASRDLVDGATIKAMAVLVEKHLAGDEHASKNVVVSKFEDRLRQAENRLGSADAAAPKASKAKAAIAEAKSLIKEEKYEAALAKMEEVVELTKEAEAEEGTVPEGGLSPTTQQEAQAPTGASETSDAAAGSGSR